MNNKTITLSIAFWRSLFLLLIILCVFPIVNAVQSDRAWLPAVIGFVISIILLLTILENNLLMKLTRLTVAPRRLILGFGIIFICTTQQVFFFLFRGFSYPFDDLIWIVLFGLMGFAFLLIIFLLILSIRGQ